MASLVPILLASYAITFCAALLIIGGGHESVICIEGLNAGIVCAPNLFAMNWAYGKWPVMDRRRPNRDSAMKRQKRKTTSKKKQGAIPGAQPVESSAPKKRVRSRRDFLQSIGYGVVGVGIVGGGGWYLATSVHAGIVEQDLSRIGNGMPTVVQIHDPQCSQCRALQREARDALSQLDAGEIQYLVANIRQPEGQALATAHSVGHVTLLLFDGSGRRRGVLAGPNTSEILLSEFRRLIRRSNSG
ncbi:hypothetical protein HBA54_19645 [Pelagibius litoralis]|uniref:Thioredoxin n=1 Tax=Pelagibius litoralis TaxID=374515 RepID=A0A967F0C9_9PROT|nr:hypothetical protein [Pelagibius litoralis]NIA70818.1 hypothetical protein [Pelagibius litoralis]